MKKILDSDLLANAKHGKLRTGRKYIIKHLTGIRITRDQAIQAKCYDCDGMGASGECDLISCPLYPFTRLKKIGSE